MNQLTSAFPTLRAGLLLGVLATALLGACGGDDEEDSTPAADGTVTWTHNGTSYTSTTTASAIVDSDTSLLITAGSEDLKNIISLRLRRIYKTGPGTYPLLKGSVLNDSYSIAGITLGGSTGTQFVSLYGPSTSNGTATVTQYDRTGQKVTGTFTFVGGALPNTSATGTQTVTNGTFTFTRFR